MYKVRNIMMVNVAVIFFVTFVAICASAEPNTPPALTWPYVSEAISPIEELTVDSPTSFQIPVLIRRPPGEGPFPLVVALHGGTKPHDIKRLRSAVTTRHNIVRLLAAGYAIAAPTFSSREQDPQTTAALRDCVAVIERVRNLPGIDSQSVFVFGGSGGGSLALELAGETKLAAIAAGEPADVLFTGAWNTKTISELSAIMAEPLKYCDNEKIRSFTQTKIDKIACPVLIVHSDVHPINKINDVFVIPMMRKAGKTPEICYVPGVRHGFYFASDQEPRAALRAFEATEAFFRRHTHTAPSPIDPSKLEERILTGGIVKGNDAPRPPRAADAVPATDAESIDWDKVRQLRKRALAGETLTQEEQTYYEKGKAAWPPR